jgi:hypothetical protein
MPTALPAMRPASGDSMPVLKALKSSNWALAGATFGRRRGNTDSLERIRALS